MLDTSWLTRIDVEVRTILESDLAESAHVVTTYVIVEHQGIGMIHLCHRCVPLATRS